MYFPDWSAPEVLQASVASSKLPKDHGVLLQHTQFVEPVEVV